MTYIRAWMSSKFGQIRPRNTELPALERPKNRCCHFFSPVFYPIPFIHVLTGNDDMHESSEEIRPPTVELAALERLKNPNRFIMGKTMLPFFLSCSLSDPFHTCRYLHTYILAVNDDIYKSSDEFEIQRVSCP